MKACAFPRADRTESQGPWAGGTKGAEQWRTEVRITAACQAGAEVTTDRDRVWGGGPGEETLVSTCAYSVVSLWALQWKT